MRLDSEAAQVMKKRIQAKKRRDWLTFPTELSTQLCEDLSAPCCDPLHGLLVAAIRRNNVKTKPICTFFYLVPNLFLCDLSITKCEPKCKQTDFIIKWLRSDGPRKNAMPPKSHTISPKISLYICLSTFSIDTCRFVNKRIKSWGR
jgi:hypothetical protein